MYTSLQNEQALVTTGWGHYASFDYLLTKNGFVTIPQRPANNRGGRRDNWEKQNINKSDEMNSWRQFLLGTMKDIIPDFNEFLGDDFKIINYVDKTKKDQSLARFTTKLEEMNVSNNEKNILESHYPPFLEWILELSVHLSRAFEMASMDQWWAVLKDVSLTHPSYFHSSPFLRELKAVKEDDTICNKYFPSNTPTYLCSRAVQGEEEGGHCFGDSGGPVAAMLDSKYVVVALVCKGAGGSEIINHQCHSRNF